MKLDRRIHNIPGVEHYSFEIIGLNRGGEVVAPKNVSIF